MQNDNNNLKEDMYVHETVKRRNPLSLRKNIKISTAQWFIIAFAFVFTIIFLFNKGWDSDSLFMIPTGDYILENGIPHTNPFSIDSDLNIVVQQWLFCVIYALFNRLPVYGSIIFTALNCAVLAAVSYCFLKRFNSSVKAKILIIFVVFMLYIGNYIAPRPEMLTLSLMLVECLALEKYRDSQRVRWLIVLPLTVLLESNMHSSMIWAHFAIWLAFFVPSLSKKYYKDSSLFKHKKEMIMVFAAMFLCSFINPYGIEATMYLFNSLKSGALSIVTIREMAKPKICSFYCMAMIVSWILLIYAFKNKTVDSVQLYLLAGFSAIAIFAIRNTMFLYISALYIIGQTVDDMAIRDLNYDQMFNRGEMMLLSVVCIFVAILNIQSIQSNIKSSTVDENLTVLNMTHTDPILKDFTDYIDNTEATVFAGYNIGGYFEFCGYTNVFMDARPELYTKNINKTKDILAEYAGYLYGNSKAQSDDKGIIDGIAEILEKYDFDYLAVSKYIEQPLYMYLEMSESENGYHEVMQSDEFVLYERG